MINKDYENQNFRANINGDYFYVRELDENKMGGKVIDGNAKGRNWTEKMDAILSKCAVSKMSFKQTWDAVIGNCSNLNCTSY